MHEKVKLLSRNWQRRKKGIDESLPRLRGEFGKGYKNKDGYIIHCRLGHPNATNAKGAIAEHTLVMCEYLGRPLKKGENIHHKNGINDDNRIENLELWTTKHPPGARVKDKLKWCREFIEEYGHLDE